MNPLKLRRKNDGIYFVEDNFKFTANANGFSANGISTNTVISVSKNNIVDALYI